MRCLRAPSVSATTNRGSSCGKSELNIIKSSPQGMSGKKKTLVMTIYLFFLLKVRFSGVLHRCHVELLLCASGPATTHDFEKIDIPLELGRHSQTLIDSLWEINVATQ